LPICGTLASSQKSDLADSYNHRTRTVLVLAETVLTPHQVQTSSVYFSTVTVRVLARETLMQNFDSD
jgi:hypothetical protein